MQTELTQFHRVAALLAGMVIVALDVAPAFGQGALQGMPHTPPPQTNTPLGAHARFSKAPINLGPANLGLAVALIRAGGGTSAFDTTKLVSELTGDGPAAQSELAALTRKFGADKVAAFVKTFNFFVTDALTQAERGGMAFPPPTGAVDGKSLSSELYLAGLPPSGKYDVEYMLDALVSHIVNVAVMNDIDANPDLGPAANATCHMVFAQVIMDLKKLYDL